MQRITLGGVIAALCAMLGMGLVVYAQQQSTSLSIVRTYNEQNEQLRESLQRGMERLQEKQQALMEWLQEGSQRIQTDQQQMDVMKQGLEQLESNRRYLEWLQQGILQLAEEQEYMDSLREGIENLHVTQQQTMQLWSENLKQQAEATEMERRRTETVHSDAEQKLIKEAEQINAAEAELKRIQDARSEAEQKLQEETQQAEAAQAEIERVQGARSEVELKLQEETQQAEAAQAEIERVQGARSEAELKLQEETQQAEAAQAEIERVQGARSEVELKLQEETQQAEAAQAELKRIEALRMATEQQVQEETQQAEAAEQQRMQAETARQEAEQKLADEAQQVEAAEVELQRLEMARLEAEQQRAEASKQAEEFEKMQAEMARLEAEQKEVTKLLQTDQPTMSDTPLLQLGGMPEVCSERVEVAQQHFAAEGFSKELWLQHVFECQECCAPILTDVMDQHVAHVVEQPHTVVLFDFDQHIIKAKYEDELHNLMTTTFDPARDKVLLIGRASKIGDRGYNIALSGKRAGEIRDYLMSTFDVSEDHIRYQFFGFDPPQLTLDYAARYGISSADLSAVDANAKKAEAKINQSVVVIIYKGNGIDGALNASQGAGSNDSDRPSKN